MNSILVLSIALCIASFAFSLIYERYLPIWIPSSAKRLYASTNQLRGTDIQTPLVHDQGVNENSRYSKGPQRWLLICILGSLSAFSPLSIDMYLPAFPNLVQQFGTNDSLVQLTLSACLLGLAAGQMIAGPLSDVLGRRRPLLIGLGAYVVASVLCAFAPNITVLIVLRFIQGFSGAAGVVISRAIVRDLYSGVEVARFFSLLMLVSGLAPILAPVIGGFVLNFMSWRGIFFILAGIGLVLIFPVFLSLRETLPEQQRQSGGIVEAFRTFRRLCVDPSFVGLALSNGLGMATMFAYISGSPFVLQEIYNVSPQTFSIIFGVNACGLILAGQINARLVGRFSPRSLLIGGLVSSNIGTLSLLFVVLFLGTNAGLFGFLPALFLTVASMGFVMPNATTLALSAHPKTAGSRSAFLGVFQFIVGAFAAPLVGIINLPGAMPMVLVMVSLSICALMMFMLTARRVGGVA